MSDNNGRNDCSLVALDELCERKIGMRDPRARPDESFTYVDISSVDNKRKQIVNAQRVLGREASSRARQMIVERDVLVATTRPKLNAVALVPQEFHDQIASTGFCVLRPTDKLDPEYLFSFVQSPDFVRKLSDLVKGALYPAVTERQVRAQEIPLPALTEQRRIAARLREQLSILAEARAALEAQLNAAEALPTAHLLAVFQSAQIQRWSREKLGTVCDFANGDAYRESDWSTSGVPIIRIQNLNDHTKPFNYWSGSLDRRVIVESGDVLLAWSGTPGTSFGAHIWRRGTAVLNQHIFRVDFDKTRLDQRWLVFAINERLGEMIGRAHGAVGLRHVTRREVESLEIPFPSFAEQRAIAERLDTEFATATALRAAIQEKLTEVEKIPSALLRSAFSVSGTKASRRAL